MADFQDFLSEVSLDNTLDGKDSDPTEQELNLDLYEGLSDKVAIQLDPVFEQMKSAQHQIWPTWIVEGEEAIVIVP